MTTAVTWRLTYEPEGKYVRFILIENALFRLMGDESAALAPIGHAYVSRRDAHLDAVAETHQLELEGFTLPTGDMRFTTTSTSPDKLHYWVWSDPARARAELIAIVLNAVMVGEVLA